MDSRIVTRAPKPGDIYGWSFKLVAFFGILLTVGGLALLQLSMTIHATGTIAARDEIYVFAPADASIAEVLVPVAAEVKEGDPIFRLSDSNVHWLILQNSKELTQLKSSLEMNNLALKELEIRPSSPEVVSAKERLTQLNRIKGLQQQSMESLEKLIKQQLVGTPEYNREQVEMIRTEMDRIQTGMMAQWGDDGLIQVQKDRLQNQSVKLADLIKLSEQEIAFLNQKLGELTIRAPMSGRVFYDEYRYTGMAVTKGTRLAKISLMDRRYQVKTLVGERNIDLLKEGTGARMSSEVFDSIFEGYVQGKVIRIVPEAKSTATNSKEEPTYEVEIAIDETPRDLVLGSRVKVDFMLERRSIFDFFIRGYRPVKRVQTAQTHE